MSNTHPHPVDCKPLRVIASYRYKRHDGGSVIGGKARCYEAASSLQPGQNCSVRIRQIHDENGAMLHSGILIPTQAFLDMIRLHEGV